MILETLVISLKVSIPATILVTIVGIILGRVLSGKSNWISKLIETLIMLPLFMPPSLIGYVIIVALGKKSFIGNFLYNNLGFSLIFTVYGAILATFIVALPIIYGTVKSALASVDEAYEEAAMDLGATRLQAFYKVALPMCYKQITGGVILSFARAFGEFGATMMVAGNIPGKTQTIPLALYYSFEYGDNTKTSILAIVVLIISTTLIFIYNKIVKNK